MLQRYANILPFYSVTSDASNHGHTRLFLVALKYWTPKHGVENEILVFYDDSDETSAGISQQIKKGLLENSLRLIIFPLTVESMLVLILQSTVWFSRNQN
jgi:hypothetical protein